MSNRVHVVAAEAVAQQGGVVASAGADLQHAVADAGVAGRIGRVLGQSRGTIGALPPPSPTGPNIPAMVGCTSTGTLLVVDPEHWASQRSRDRSILKPGW